MLFLSFTYLSFIFCIKRTTKSIKGIYRYNDHLCFICVSFSSVRRVTHCYCFGLGMRSLVEMQTSSCPPSWHRDSQRLSTLSLDWTRWPKRCVYACPFLNKKLITTYLIFQSLPKVISSGLPPFFSYSKLYRLQACISYHILLPQLSFIACAEL